jgi:hypothetical protein
LTVVFDDDDLYRRVKVRAAETGVPMKTLVQEALLAYLDGSDAQAAPGTPAEKTWDWDAFDRWQEEIRKADERLGADYPTDLSNVKEYLYGSDERPRRSWMAAEERAEYDPR